jgi:transposase, IS30 family
VQALLVKKYSPEQIAGVLARTYPDRPEMQVSHETIYKALYVQGRGELRRELAKCLRTGRALRRPRGRPRAGNGRGRIPGMVNISERPAEATDRAVPGHWEGDLILGKNQRSQIGTLVERSTGFVQLLHLPARRDPDPHSPWQRGSNENTNGLLRQYFPKGTDLSVHTADYLAEVAAELNERPRKRFGWDSPAQVLNRLLSSPTGTTVATKP